MKTLRMIGLGFCLAVAAVTMSGAAETTSGALTISDPQARPNLPNRPTAAYMVIANNGAEADRLLSAASPVFAAVKIHPVMKHGDVMKMMPVDGIDLPAGGTAVLEPGGFHIMLFGGEAAMKVGDMFPLILTFERGGQVEIMVHVRKIGHDRKHGDHSGHGN